MSNLRAGIESVHPSPWIRARDRTGARQVREWTVCRLPHRGTSPAPEPGVCVGHGAPGAAPPLCPQDPADEECLNSLDFHSRNLMDVFITALLDTCPGVWRSLWHVTHITLLESDSGLGVHFLFSDFLWFWDLVSHDCPFISCHLL